MNANLRSVKYRIAAALGALLLGLGACGDASEPVEDEGDGDAIEDEEEIADPGADDGDVADEATGDVEPIHLVASTTLGGTDGTHNVPVLAYLDAVEEASNGQITYEFFAANALVSPTELPSAFAAGTVDIGVFIGAFTPDDFPVDNWLTQYGFINNASHPGFVFERMAANVEWWHTTGAQYNESEFLGAGVKSLAHGTSASMDYNLLCNDPVTNLDEASGVQIRTPGPAWAAEAANLGAEAVSLPGAELYEAVQRGIVDCAMADAAEMVDLGLWDLASHFTGSGLFPGFISLGLGMSASTWDEMSLEQQTIMWETLPVYLEGVAFQLLRTRHEFFTEGAERGLTYHEASSDMVDRIETYQAGLIDDASETAPPAVEDPDGALDGYVAAHERWAQILSDDIAVPDFETWEEWALQVSDESEMRDLAKKFADRLYEDVLAPLRP